VGLTLVVLLRSGAAFAVDRLKYPVHDFALTDRTGAVGTTVVPSVKFVLNAEDPDFKFTANYDLTITVGVFAHLTSAIIRHESSSS
jgi:hypothetical protein